MDGRTNGQTNGWYSLDLISANRRETKKIIKFIEPSFTEVGKNEKQAREMKQKYLLSEASPTRLQDIMRFVLAVSCPRNLVRFPPPWKAVTRRFCTATVNKASS